MSVLADIVTLGERNLYTCDVSPMTGTGLAGNIGDLALAYTGDLFIKKTAAATGWARFTDSTYYSITTTTPVSTTSSTYAQVGTLTLTPVAGTYLALFSGNFRIASNNADGNVAISLGTATTTLPETIRRQFTSVSVLLGVINNSIGSSGVPTTVLTANGSQAVMATFKSTNGGTITVDAGHLFLLRLA